MALCYQLDIPVGLILQSNLYVGYPVFEHLNILFERLHVSFERLNILFERLHISFERLHISLQRPHIFSYRGKASFDPS